MTDDIAAVLALVQTHEAEQAEAETPVPPNGASVRAQGAWYEVLRDIDLETPAEWRILESIVEVITQYDLVKSRWESEGSRTEAVGSMGQPTEAPELATMAKLRTQEAALWKQLALPTSASGEKRRPGRPTRANSNPGARWGTS